MKNHNQDIANIFYEMADILEMQNVEWKPQAYVRAAKALEALKEDVKAIYKREGIKGLVDLQAIGEHLAKKIVEFIDTRKIKSYEKLKKSVPAHINLLMKIPGMGAKRVKKLNEVLKITNIKQLETAARAHKISKIPGFGEKSERDILDNLKLSDKSEQRFPLKEAQKAADKIINLLKKLKAVKNISVAGSIRRKKPTIRDIDILASSNNPEKIINAFTNLKGIKKVFGKGPTKATIILESGIQADLRVLKPESWGAGLFYFTGSKNYNIETRKIAIKKGYKLNEYGLFDKKTGKIIAGRTEEEICKQLGVKCISPEEREI